MSRASALRPARWKVSWIFRSVAAATALALLPSAVSAEPSSPAQSVGSLQEKADRIAADIDRLDERTNALAEQYNDAVINLDALKTKLAETQQQVGEARAALESNRNAAVEAARRSFVGSAGGDGSFLGGGGGELEAASRRETYLSTRHDSSEQAIEDVSAAQQDLAERQAQLDAAKSKVDQQVADLDASKQQLDTTIADRKKLLEGVQGELKAALAAEQARRAAAAEAAAKAAADAAAAQSRQARRPSAAVAVQPNGSTRPAAPSTPRAVTPPPAGAPRAVEVALAQQGDPYRWAASGPDAFDCSGLVMYAYAAAGRSLPHSSRSLRGMTRSLSADELQPGDLVFGGSPVHHVGIYIGNGQMVHAPHTGDVVRVASIYSTSKPVSFGRL